MNTGWNVGQLMYVLLVNGFCVKTGMFIKCGYSICAYVRKEEFELPVLRGDEGDIEILNKANLWPCPVSKIDGVSDKFFGDILALNWQNAEYFIKNNDGNKRRKVLKSIAHFIHKLMGDQYFNKLCEVFADESNFEDLLNPDSLN